MEKVRVTKEMIEEKFQNDPVYLSILQDEELKGKLFPDFIYSLTLTDEYSTKVVADFISSTLDKASDNNIRYYMRSTNLEDYIEPIQRGRNYRLLYTSVYKIYLIFLYLSHTKSSRNLNDIKALLPEYTVQEFVKGKNHNKVVNDTNIDKQERLSEKYYEMAMIALMYGQHHEKSLEKIDDVICHIGDVNQTIGDTASDFWIDMVEMVQIIQETKQNFSDILAVKIEIEQNKDELNQLQIELNETKSVLRNNAQFNNIHKLHQEIRSEKAQSSSFFGRLFPKKNTDNEINVDFEKVTGNELEITTLQEKIKAKQQEIQNLDFMLQKLETERKRLDAKKVELDLNKMEKLKDSMIKNKEAMLEYKTQMLEQKKQTAEFNRYAQIEHNSEETSNKEDIVVLEKEVWSEEEELKSRFKRDNPIIDLDAVE